jgi:hypothetical protein
MTGSKMFDYKVEWPIKDPNDPSKERIDIGFTNDTESAQKAICVGMRREDFHMDFDKDNMSEKCEEVKVPTSNDDTWVTKNCKPKRTVQ